MFASSLALRSISSDIEKISLYFRRFVNCDKVTSLELSMAAMAQE